MNIADGGLGEGKTKAVIMMMMMMMIMMITMMVMMIMTTIMIMKKLIDREVTMFQVVVERANANSHYKGLYYYTEKKKHTLAVASSPPLLVNLRPLTDLHPIPWL